LDKDGTQMTMIKNDFKKWKVEKRMENDGVDED